MKKCIIVLIAICCAFAVFAADTTSYDIQTVINNFSYYVGANQFATYENYYGINVEYFIQGALDVANGNFQLTEEQVQNVVNAFGQYYNEKLKTENLAYAESFLASNKTKSGVVTTKSGLQYKINTKGSGAKANKNSTVSVYYTLTLPDGTVVDKVDSTNGPAKFSLTQVVPGFAEACTVAPVGSSLTAWIHPSLGYGENGAGSYIEPNTLLQFDITIVEIN